MLKKIIFVRHGQSEGNVDHQAYVDNFDHTVKLTKLGRQQAKEANKELKMMGIDDGSLNTCIIYSPYARAKETYQIGTKGISDHIERVEDPFIREQEWVQIPESIEQVGAEVELMKKMGTYFYRFSSGESYADTELRIFTAVKHYADNGYERLILFSHANAINAMVRRLLEISTEDFDQMPHLENCAVLEIELDIAKKGYKIGHCTDYKYKRRIRKLMEE